MKKNFNLKKILGIATMLTFGIAHAQSPPPSSSTHCTTIMDDCSQGVGKVQVTFNINRGNLTPIDPIDEYKVEIKLYRGEWTQAGWAFTVVNEIQEDFKNSQAVTNPSSYNTSTFYSTAPYFIVTKNGAYRAQTTLKQNTVSNGWVAVAASSLSPYYAVNDVTLEPIGDWAEVAHIENLRVGFYFNYKINGQAASTPAPSFITCQAVPLTIDNVIGGADNPGTSTVTVEKGSLAGNLFTTSGSPSSMSFATTNANQNLNTLFSTYLNNYSGALRVTYKLPDDVCGSTSTPVSKTMTISVATAAFLNDYKSRIANNPACPGSSKPIIETVSGIASTMPTGGNLSDFRCNIKAAPGWAGAGNVGLNNLTFSVNYAVDVYEVDHVTGLRLPGAPSLFRKNGTTPTTDDFSFNDGGFGAGFNSADPYYADLSAPADPNGSTGGGDYFKMYYAFAKSKVADGTDPNALINFSAKVFCAEVSQFPSSGCIVNKKNYFRIAHASFSNAGTARLASSDEETEEEYLSLDVYPNPTKGELIIPVTEDDTNVSIRIMDNLGKEVYTTSDVRSGCINIEKLTAGIYFYTIQKNGEVYRGKVVKE